MLPKIDPKIKRKLTLEITENHENIIRMQDAKTQKSCSRVGAVRALLAKSAGFKQMPEYIQTSHENYTKTIKNMPTTIQIPPPPPKKKKKKKR